MGNPHYATNPATGQHLQPGFVPAAVEDVELAARLAAEAFAVYGRTPGRAKAAFLRKIAAKIESIASEVIERAGQETALSQARLQGETARTCGQLRLFAQVAEEGSWVAARIDRADPERKPAAKPDLRSMLRPLGPVVVFGASNFPLAFSVAGGDTASALAAGSGNRESTCGPSRHQRTGGTRGARKRTGMRSAGGSILRLVWQWRRDRHRVDEASTGESRRLHRIAHRRKNFDGRGSIPPRADSILRGNEQHEPRLYFAGSAARAR